MRSDTWTDALRATRRGARVVAACVAAFSTALCLALASSVFAAEAFEVGPLEPERLPRGKEADGIIGDLVLRNDRVEAVVSGNHPERRANAITFPGADGVTPGCLYDLTLRGSHNDQLTLFAPSGQQGAVSAVRVAKDGRDGEASVETVRRAAGGSGLFVRHEYRLRDGMQGVLVVTTLRNEGPGALAATPDDRFTQFAVTGTTHAITWADAVDPADKAGYAFGWVEHAGRPSPPSRIELAPGQEISFARFVAVGTSPLEAVGLVLAQRGDATARLAGRVTDAEGAPVTSARLVVSGFADAGAPPAAYPDAAGRFRLRLPPGPRELEASDLGRETLKRRIALGPDASADVALRMSAASGIAFDVRGASGAPIPCKAQFRGVDGTATPYLGPPDRARGCVDQVHSPDGRFRQALPPGRYQVTVTHGIEFGHLRRTVTVEPSRTATVEGVLERLVDTRGWVSADYHNHSTASGDNTCGTDDRIINLAAEQIEFAPATEHNRLSDWRPHIARLGLAREIQSVPGIELTGPGAHLNAFPFTPLPFAQDGGAPAWNEDPRIGAVTLRDWQRAEPARWVQLNHPNLVQSFIDGDRDGRTDGGLPGLTQRIDGIELQSYSGSRILDGVPFVIGRNPVTGRDTLEYVREFIWLQLLNAGHRLVGVAVNDAHAVHGSGAGGWRMYLPSASDEPARIDWRENALHAKAGRIILSNGPFLEVRTGDGTIAGGETRAHGAIELHVRVQCTDWIDVDRVQVLVNGRQRPDLNFTRASHPELFGDGVVKFDRVLAVTLSEDSHVIVVALGENSDLGTGYGTSPQSRMQPCAYNNPIYVDVDGGGFTPNGDTLDWALPVGGISVEAARELLAKRPSPPAARPASAAVQAPAAGRWTRELAKGLLSIGLALGSLGVFVSLAGRSWEALALRRMVVWITLAKAALCVGLYVSRPAAAFASDAAVYYLPETLRWFAGEIPYRDFRSGYSPLFHFLLMPAVHLWPGPGSVVATIFAFDVALIVLYARRFARSHPLRTWRVLFLYCSSPISFYWVALTGYNSVLIAFFTLIALLLADGRRDRAAGIVAVLGLAFTKLTMIVAWPAIAFFSREGVLRRIGPMLACAALVPVLMAVRIDLLQDALHGRFLATSGNVWFLLSALSDTSVESPSIKLASMLSLLCALSVMLGVHLRRVRPRADDAFDRASALFAACGLAFMVLAYKSYPWYMTMCLIFLLHTLVGSGRASIAALGPLALLGALTTIEPGLSIGLRSALGPHWRRVVVPVDLVVIACVAYYAWLCFRIAVAPAPSSAEHAR